MTTHLEHLAHRLESDPFFLACPLELYAKSEALTDEKLAACLECDEAVLLSLRLCRAPTPDSESFFDEIERVSARFSVNTDALAAAVRRGQLLFEMAQGQRPSNTVVAARDADEDDDGATRGTEE